MIKMVCTFMIIAVAYLIGSQLAKMPAGKNEKVTCPHHKIHKVEAVRSQSFIYIAKSAIIVKFGAISLTLVL